MGQAPRSETTVDGFSTRSISPVTLRSIAVVRWCMHASTKALVDGIAGVLKSFILYQTEARARRARCGDR